MRYLHGNFPDEVWARLKAWAKAACARPDRPTVEECSDEVERIAAEITGIPNVLRPEVVNFYARETVEMTARFRDELGEAAV
jgi:hypothetical protein